MKASNTQPNLDPGPDSSLEGGLEGQAVVDDMTAVARRGLGKFRKVQDRETAKPTK